MILTAEKVANESDQVTWQIYPNRVNAGFTEGARYRIRKPGEDCLLVVDDQELEEDEDYWHWSPGFYAGRVTAELFVTGQAGNSEYSFDVSPHTDKLGSEEFQEMLEQIWASDPSLVIGTEPAQIPIGHEMSLSDPWLEFSRLKTYGTDFVESLNRIARNPIRELQSKRLQVPAQYVRKTDRQTALAAIRNPAMVSALFSPDSRIGDPGESPLFDVPVARETLDSAANRCIAQIARMVTFRALALLQTLAELVEHEIASETRSDLASRWPRRRAFLQNISSQLRRLQRTAPLSEVNRAELSAAGLNAVAADPAYSSAYRLGWSILRRGVDGCPDSENLWISPTWEIYERWCYVRLCEVLTDLFPAAVWNLATAHGSGARRAYSGADETGVRFTLLLQPKFPAVGSHERSGFRSISKAREPDIVLIVENDTSRRWYVFDAKYRTTRSNVLDAMTSAHVYQDSLRFHRIKPALSMLLVPRGGGAEELENIEYLRENSVGVASLNLHGTNHHIAQLLKRSCLIKS